MDVKNILKYLLGIINAKDGIDLRKCHLLAIDENKSIEPCAFISIHYFKVVHYIVPR